MFAVIKGIKDEYKDFILIKVLQQRKKKENEITICIYFGILVYFDEL